MPNPSKNKQNMSLIDALQQLNKSRIVDSMLFFDWLFHRSQAVQTEIDQSIPSIIIYQIQKAVQTFVDQYGKTPSTPSQRSSSVSIQRPQNQKNHPEINGPTNAFRIMFVQNSAELKNELGINKLQELTRDKKYMWFASNADSTEMQALKNSIKSFSLYLNKPKHDRNTNPLQFEKERQELEESIQSIKAQCNNYLETHKGWKWTPTGRAREALVENALKLTQEYENLAKVDGEELTVGKELKERVQYTVEHPMHLAKNNKSLGIKTGSHKITDVSKAIKPVDFNLLQFSDSQEYKDIVNLTNSMPELQNDPKYASLFSLTSNMKWLSELKPEDRLLGHQEIWQDKNFYQFESSNASYDTGAAAVYRNINEYVLNNLNDLKNPDSLASKLMQTREKYFPSGNLVIPDDTKGKFIDATGRPNKQGMYDENTFNGDDDLLFSAFMLRDANPSSNNDFIEMQNLAQEPLFPKEPHPSDIKQGLVGNCYFLSYFSKLAHDNPQAIKDMLKDNGDGTVTCKFFNDDNEPVFVKVNKTVPYTFHTDPDGVSRVNPTNKENSPLWVHMLEKAYMMSGIRPVTNFTRTDCENRYAKLNNVSANVNPNRTHPTQVEMALFQKRFPNTPYNQQMFDRTLQHGYLGLGGGFSEILNRRVTGKKSYSLPIQKYTKSGLAGMLKAHDPQSMSMLFGKLDPKITEHNFAKYYIPRVLQHASNTLNNDISQNFGFHTANPESKFTYSSVTLGQVENSIKSFLNTEEFRKCTPEYQKGIKYITDSLTNSLREHQKNNEGNEYVLPDNESGPGHYSKYDDKLFEKISKSLDGNHFVSMALAGHDFSVLGYKEENGKKSLICRNPWGYIGLDKSGVKYTPIDKRDAQNYTKSDTGGVFEIEINEVSAKALSLGYEEDTKALSKDDMKTVLTKQLIETYVKEQPQNKQEKFRQRLMNKTVFEKTKSSKLIENLSTTYMNNPTIKLHVEQGGTIPDHLFYRDVKHFSGNDLLAENGPKVVNNNPIRTVSNSLDKKTLISFNDNLEIGDLNRMQGIEEGVKAELRQNANKSIGPVL